MRVSSDDASRKVAEKNAAAAMKVAGDFATARSVGDLVPTE